VLIIPETRTSGFEIFLYLTSQIQRSVYFRRVLRLLSSPSYDSESVTLEEPYEMVSPKSAHRPRRACMYVHDAPRRTAIRWVLAGLNAMRLNCPSADIQDARPSFLFWRPASGGHGARE
jgi:hypothetical protein